MKGEGKQSDDTMMGKMKEMHGKMGEMRKEMGSMMMRDNTKGISLTVLLTIGSFAAPEICRRMCHFCLKLQRVSPDVLLFLR